MRSIFDGAGLRITEEKRSEEYSNHADRCGPVRGYFALVMATGIISTATFLLDMKWLAWALLVINLIAYAVLSS
jgi:hypothetical protein